MFSLLITRPKTPIGDHRGISFELNVSERSENHNTRSPDYKFANGKPIPEIIRFDVQLDRPRQTFFSGDVVSGEVRVQLAECLTVKGIIVRFVGEAYVYVPPEEPPQWDMRRIVQLKKAFLSKNKVRPSAVVEGGDGAGKISFATPASEQPPAQINGNGSILVEPSTPSNLAPQSTGTKNKISALKAKQQQGSFKSSEKYFEHKFYVFGHKYSSAKESLWPGVHAFPFQYTLPTKLPTSFHGRFGYVRYFCEASLERPWLPSVKRKSYFSVSANADVNLESKAESSAGGQKSSNQCFFCCSRGTVVVEASVSRRGYVPGETIHISAEIANMSINPVTSTVANLVQVATYHSSKGFRHRVDEQIVTHVEQGTVLCGESRSWFEVPMLVPSLPASFSLTDCCKVLDVEYRLDFVAVMGGNEEPLVISMPLVIGTVPLLRTFKSLQMPDPLLGSPLARMTNLKYKGFPAVFSVPCIWGPKVLEQYFHREVPRVSEDGIRVYIPGETFAPRYVCYRSKDDEKPQRASAELLTNEPTPKKRRSRASSLQPQTALKHLSDQRITQSSVHLSAQQQPINDPIIRSLAQLKACQKASTSKEPTDTRVVVSSLAGCSMETSSTMLSIGARSTKSSSSKRQATDNTSSSAHRRGSGADKRGPRPCSSTSDGFWDVKGGIATISDRLPTAPAAMDKIEPSHMNY
ncbi:Hypothetical predicted protein [Cloeon dipterum]|uniref:Arrestin C-terminal-like domain-containing protein n=1 Tax=Cloeon dipterum TaxID=197152 RepID=A0A8S1CJ54_9INSE|nr:Hypothetical predicted protein [Cloeon dipterum]